MKKLLILFVFIASMLTVSFLNVEATLTGTKMYDGIDYSGQGTRVDKPIRKYQATLNGQYLRIGVNSGKYENQEILVNDWIFHSWSSWSTTNNKTNDYYTYRGQSITEYNVEQKTEHLYRRWNDQKTPVYQTVYVTEYVGNKWYNFFITYTDTSSIGYPGVVANFNISSRYTYNIVIRYLGGYDYKTWTDTKPTSLPWENSWEAYQSRTVYRYRHRTITWNENSNPTFDNVPLKYSFNDTNGNPINYGIKWTLEHRFSPDANDDITLVQYHISAEDVKKLIEKDLESIEDSISPHWSGIVTHLGTNLLGHFLNSKLIGTILGKVGLVLALAEGHDYIISAIRANEINSLQDILNYAIDLDVNIAIETFSITYLNYNTGSLPTNSLEGNLQTITDRYMNIGYNNFNSISLQYIQNKGVGYGNWYNDQKIFGRVDYITNPNHVKNVMEEYLFMKYGVLMLLPWNI